MRYTSDTLYSHLTLYIVRMYTPQIWHRNQIYFALVLKLRYVYTKYVRKRTQNNVQTDRITHTQRILLFFITNCPFVLRQMFFRGEK